MKRSIPLVLILTLAACGGAKKDATEPGNADETASAEGGAADIPAVGDSTPTTGKPAPGDDATKKSSPCGGFDIADLASVLSQAACEIANPNPNEQKDLKDALEIKVVPDSP